MILVDAREPSNIRTALTTRGEGAMITTLPFGDVWVIKGWDFAAIPQNLAQLYAAVPLEKHALVGDPLEAAQNPGLAFLQVVARDAIVIERKTLGDLLNSIRDKRLFEQAERVREHARMGLLVLTEPIYIGRDGKVKRAGQFDTGWNYLAVTMALFKVAAMGVPVLPVFESYFPDFVGTLHDWLHREPKPPSPKPPMLHDVDPLTPEEAFIAMIPGVGPIRAREVMEFAGSAVNALLALTWPETTSLPDKPKGIGKGTIRKVRDFLGIPGGWTLTLVQEEEE